MTTTLVKRELIRSIRGDVPRVSFHRMTRSREFDELCRYYEYGIGGVRDIGRFAELSARLEETFLP